MMLAPLVVRNIKQRLSVMTDDQLNNMLDRQKSILNNIKLSYSEENYEYLSISIKQKIKLIEQELNHRNISTTSNI